MTSTSSAQNRLASSGRFMVAVGALVLSGASLLLPEDDKATRIGMVIAGVALAMATIVAS